MSETQQELRDRLKDQRDALRHYFQRGSVVFFVRRSRRKKNEPGTWWSIYVMMPMGVGGPIDDSNAFEVRPIQMTREVSEELSYPYREVDDAILIDDNDPQKTIVRQLCDHLYQNDYTALDWETL